VRALTAEQMREADTRGQARLGDVALMRAAGERLHEAIVAFMPAAGPVVAFAGPGNNGGDAFAALALVDSTRPRIIYALEARTPSAARRDAEERAKAAGVEVRRLPATGEEATAALDGASVALDALLGTGSRAEPGEELVPAIEALNAFPRDRVLAADIPTGVDASSGAVAGHAVRAGITVSLGALKVGLLLDPARALVGTLFVGDLGLSDEIGALGAPFYATLTPDEFCELLPQRSETADKRSAGAPLIIAGSHQFPGAAVLSARGAARSGAGYVTVATPNNTADLLRAHLIEQVVVGFDERDGAAAVEGLLDLTNHCGAVAIGPGLGLSDAIGEVVRGFIARLELPFVVDASGLFHLAKNLDILRGKKCVLTPHAGEFARLSGEGTVKEGERATRLRRFVERTGVTTLLKGRATLIDDGTTMHVNPTGTSALATAGTGDVLTGMIATLLSQGLAPVDAARVAAYWHGLAAKLIGNRTRGIMAGDVVDALGPTPIMAPYLVMGYWPGENDAPSPRLTCIGSDDRLRVRGEP
jgi:NAD(P)H-hydrate epimerase